MKTEEDKKDRIAKFISRAGVCSRRDAEKLIAAGRVSVNGDILDTPAFKVDGDDIILIDGAPLPVKAPVRLWRFHKPAGLITTSKDEKERKTIFDALPDGMPRVMTIGRLDYNTEGLLLLTNDGELARRLELPTTGWIRRYKVRAHGQVSQERLTELKKGVEVDGIKYGSIDAKVERGEKSNIWLTLALKEGKNREVRKVLEHLGLQVNRLIRLSYGPFQLGNLPIRNVEEISPKVIRSHLGKKLSEGLDMPKEKPPRRRPNK